MRSAVEPGGSGDPELPGEGGRDVHGGGGSRDDPGLDAPTEEDQRDGSIVVVGRAVAGAVGVDGQETAASRLDREIVVEDLIDRVIEVDPPHNEVHGDTPVDERRVWVFPPAIERLDDEEWVVQGTSPVVAIDVRSLLIYP